MLSKIETQLFSAIEKDNSDEVRRLINAGASLAVKNEQDLTPAQYAGKKLAWNCADIIISLKNTNETDTYRYGSLLLWAVRGKQLALVKRLLILGVSAEWYVPGSGYKCLHFAAENKDPQMVRLLLTYHSDPTKVTLAGQTPIELACSLGHWECVKVFIEYFSVTKFKFKDKQQSSTAYWAAVKAGQLVTAEQLLAAGATIGSIKLQGSICLQWLVKEWNNITYGEKVVAYLIQKKFALNWEIAEGKTALDYAIILKHKACILYLESLFSLPQANLSVIALEQKLVDGYRNRISDLFDSLCDKTLMNEEIVQAIEYLRWYFLVILNNHRIHLTSQRQELKANSQKLSVLPESATDELNKISSLIEAINTIMKQPQKIPTLKALWDVKTPVGDDIQGYLLCKEKIDDYILRLRILIKNIEIKIEQIKNQQGFIVQFQMSRDSYLQQYTASLKKTPSDQDILEIYKGLISIIKNIEASADINEIPAYLSEFYLFTSKEFSNISFLPDYEIETPCSTQKVQTSLNHNQSANESLIASDTPHTSEPQNPVNNSKSKNAQTPHAHQIRLFALPNDPQQESQAFLEPLGKQSNPFG